MRFALALIGAALVASACSPQPSSDDGLTGSSSPARTATAAETASISPTPSPEAGHSGERAMEHVEALAGEIGPRVAGTPDEADAADYIAAYLDSLGYEADIRPFTFAGDRFRPSEITVRGETVTAVSLNGSGAGAIDAPLRYVGLADEADLAGQDLEGVIAVADRGEVRFAEKASAVADRGAAALIIINTEPGTFVGNLDADFDIPIVGVGREDAEVLHAAAESGDRAAFTVDESSVEARNVLAGAPGAGQCEIIVGGHYDTVPGAPGANDNASGTANVLELARALAADGVDSGLCFAAFGAEESGLNGSRVLVAELRDAGELPQYMVNLDVTGIGDTVEVYSLDAQLAGRAVDAAERAGAPYFRVPGVITNSDHKSFDDAGVPAVFLSSGGFDTIHSPEDAVEDIDSAELDRVGDTAYELILDLLTEVAAG